MNVQPSHRMQKAAFLAWQRQHEGRYELVRGHTAMMVGVAKAHIRIVQNLLAALRTRLDPRLWEAFAELGLDAGPDTLRYPDIVVDRAGGADGDYLAATPVLLAEVLSPSTTAVDLGDKLAEYLDIATVSVYLVLAQNAAKAWLWERVDGKFTPKPRVVTGLDAVIPLTAVHIEVPMAEIYAGVAIGE